MTGRVRRASMEELSPFITACLEEGKTVEITVTGNSMRPLLHHLRDGVALQRAEAESLRPGDVPLYKRENGQYVLHRVIAVVDGTYTMMGDAQLSEEPGIRPGQILAVARGFYIGKRYVDCSALRYRLYTRIWLRARLLRRLILRLDRMGERS